MIKKILLIMSSLLLSFTLFACESKDTTPTYDIHTELQNAALARKDPALIMLDVTGDEELSKPLPVTLTWSEEVFEATLTIKNKAGNYESTFIVSGTSADIYNLRIAEEYTWYLNDIEQGVFRISTQVARFLNIDGVTNVRDLGGYKTIDGKTVKQDMIIRSAKYTADETGEQLITEAGIKELEKIGIKCELDLRRLDNGEVLASTTSVLGQNVDYIQLPMLSSGNIFTLNKNNIPALFSILGNKDNYPMVFHCSIGTDRTGFVAFLILSVLGVDETSIKKDYMLSNFGLIGGSRAVSIVNNYFNTVKYSAGETHQEKTINYLKGIGVSETDINNMIELLTE